MGYYGFPAYVSVANRKRKAEQQINKRRKKGEDLNPVVIEGRIIVRSFWGKAWCQHLETFKDRNNRLERGRSYLRSNTVIDLVMNGNTVRAQVMGSAAYKVNMVFSPISNNKWQKIVHQTTGKIDSLVDLLKGSFSADVMKQMIDVETGLFPGLKEANITCSCPDWSSLCKHSAAVFYGIGHRLDTAPELLFSLRGVNHLELLKLDALEDIITSAAETNLEGNLSAIFGINLEEKITMKKKKKK